MLAQLSPAWFKTFQENLKEWIENASPADWLKLEAQDPFGTLKKLSFVHLVNKLIVFKID